jgi:hypothetical protein
MSHFEKECNRILYQEGPKTFLLRLTWMSGRLEDLNMTGGLLTILGLNLSVMPIEIKLTKKADCSF